MIKTFENFHQNDTLVPTDNSPYGYYHISNALEPTELFKQLDIINIKYDHDHYHNIINIYTDDIQYAKHVRKLILSDIFEADSIDHMDLEFVDDGDYLIIHYSNI